jgi:hypothetical protein
MERKEKREMIKHNSLCVLLMFLLLLLQLEPCIARRNKSDSKE